MPDYQRNQDGCEEGVMRKLEIIAVTALSAGMLLAPTSFAGVPSIAKQSVAATQGGGNVLPAQAQPKGYSLLHLAKTTAAFNVSDHSGALPKVPFQMLFWTADNAPFHVRPGTMLYVPILYNSDSPPVVGNYPDVTDRTALVAYWYSQQEFGAVYTTITVDGQVTSLGPDYLVGVKFATPLPDTAMQYMTVAAVLTPLTKGEHTVEINALVTGDAIKAIFGGEWQSSATYTVIVK
jgi:hypothetical protein